MRVRACVRACACVHRSAPICPMYRDPYLVTSVNTAPVLRMSGGCMSVPHPCIHMYIHVYVHTCMLRFVSASTVPSPPSHGPTRTDGSVLVYSIYTHPALCADRRTRVSLEADMRHVHAQACVIRACGRALVCVRGRARIRANACEHFTPPPSVVFSARRRSGSRRPSTRTSARGTPCESRRWTRYAPLPAGAHCGGLYICVYVCICMYMYKYVYTYVYVCSYIYLYI
jgi:hypothetical protein